MKTRFTFILATAFTLSACGGQNQNQASSADKQIAENQKQIELLKQQAEIQRLQKEISQNQVASQPISAENQVFQLAASEVANTIPQAAQAAAKAGEVVQGLDGQQYTYDPDSGNWLLYGAIGAAAGYLMSNAMNNRNAARYTPVSKPTAAVSRVYQDYQKQNPTKLSPRQQVQQQAIQKQYQPQSTQAQQKATPNYRPTQQGYSNSNTPAPARKSFGFGGGRRKR
ncbi:hypothetical protein [Kingella negevensis]|uniref:hypothetical protein n=1 Tax=Kingella negevensis TaxID=1522312 RepID=UPI00254FE8BE|nr:hypothetical protein [Kingella negevensis]MDK4680640.1 hypothetical protein [Kingella negevensis]MDK4681637.1 hypothetical protein [Kingella negevensis]MDK4689835.1 hypothetical protein [Kingella negevensis]MDK4692821.1 hypothetical protein [Kingella negevensis]MDK4699121.1 hypothetical protein [Kingella negevensis]